MILFFDIDGVLADFVGGALKVHGAASPWDIEENKGNYNFQELLGLSASKFWEPLEHNFWAELDPLPEGMAVLRLFSAINTTYLSTSPSLSPGCSSGKHEWVNKHLPQHARNLFIGSQKQVFGRIPGAVLIDDCDTNIDKFRDAGGTGILYPQPWNSAHQQMQDRIGYIWSALYGFNLHEGRA